MSFKCGQPRNKWKPINFIIYFHVLSLWFTLSWLLMSLKVKAAKRLITVIVYPVYKLLLLHLQGLGLLYFRIETNRNLSIPGKPGCLPKIMWHYLQLLWHPRWEWKYDALIFVIRHNLDLNSDVEIPKNSNWILLYIKSKFYNL